MAYKPNNDKVLFFTTGLMTIFGLVMVYSASSATSFAQHSVSYYFFLRQLVYAIGGFALLVVLMNVDYHVWQKPKILLFLGIICIGALGFVLTQPKVNGAHRWLRFGSLGTFQPSELAKLIVLMFVAWYLGKFESEINRPIRRLLPFGIVIGLFAGLIVKEPDLGQAICLCLMVAVLLYSAGLAWHYFAGAVLIILPALCIAVAKSPYQWKRIKAFLNPYADPLGYGWQSLQSLIAVGSGGLSGLGLGGSKQKFYFLSEQSSDFIFAVIGEELGLIGTILVLLAFLLYFYRGMRIALQSPDRFGFYLGLGITMMVILQGIINISVVLAMLPPKGIALPFISQGGSSLLLNLLATGVLLNLSHYTKSVEVAE
jgi:cell division protein FtsW